MLWLSKNFIRYHATCQEITYWTTWNNNHVQPAIDLTLKFNEDFSWEMFVQACTWSGVLNNFGLLSRKLTNKNFNENSELMQSLKLSLLEMFWKEKLRKKINSASFDTTKHIKLMFFNVIFWFANTFDNKQSYRIVFLKDFILSLNDIY